MKILGIIPARYVSSRFPGKSLVVINGKTMIRRVYEQALKCKDLDDVIVATDDESIRMNIDSFGGQVMMTSEKHRSGTERCQEVVQKLTRTGKKYDVIINIQGDEPYIDPLQIKQVVSCFQQPETQVGTLIKKIISTEELTDPNIVKVAIDVHGKALYFSRSPIPFTRGKNTKEWINYTIFYKHIGIYGYRSDVLKQLADLPSSLLESAESLEQLRWLENGVHIQTQITDIESISIDAPADLLKITNRS